MAYQLPASKIGDGFDVEVDGETFTIPLMQGMTGADLQILSALDVSSSLAAALGLVNFFEHLGVPARRLKFDQVGWLFDAWKEASEVSLGESAGSPKRSPSTAKKSNTRSLRKA